MKCIKVISLVLSGLFINIFIFGQSIDSKSSAIKTHAEVKVIPIKNTVSNIGISVAGKKQALPATKFAKQELLSDKDGNLITFSDTSLRVIRFDLYTNLNGFEVTESSDSNSLSEKMKIIITRMKIGAKGYIKNIHYKYPNGVIRETNVYVFQVIQ